MALTLEAVLGLATVSFLWGVTNPLMKKGAQGIERIKSHSITSQFLNDVVFLVRNFKYMIPFLINQCGSLIYVVVIQQTDLSLTVVVANSLTFAITALTGIFLGEKKVHRNTYLGIILILLGTTVCCVDKMDSSS
ncbi:transmembrane protein 234 homolog [Copidosoma floridanum]|uniref:transmembrane protein 234 homolog n=1 Tax=Copidosoma floridanum TaxID=29053 RepID=UPI0006C99064|nr:transmembrane protein 234 homolog [Copidosoma floridanum]